MPRTDSLPFPLIWELDSILPHPESADFRAVLTDYRSRLMRLSEETDHLPPLNAEPQNVSAWKRLLAGFAAVEMLAGDLASFAGCHAAATLHNQALQVGGASHSKTRRISGVLGYARTCLREAKFSGPSCSGGFRRPSGTRPAVRATATCPADSA